MSYFEHRLASLLASDTKATTQPDVDTPFSDAADVVKRLLPWHIWQHPSEDVQSLAWPATVKGKKKASDKDLVEAELAGALFVFQNSSVINMTLRNPFRPAM
jgi:hypothetical protein